MPKRSWQQGARLSLVALGAAWLVVVGCSGRHGEIADLDAPDANPTSATDAGSRTPNTGSTTSIPQGDPDAGSSQPPSETGYCPRPAPPPPTIKPVGAQVDACDTAALSFIADKIYNSPNTYSVKQFATDLTAAYPSCAQCVITHQGDSTWGPMIYYGADDASAFYNLGGCVERALGSGGNFACNVSYQRSFMCTLAVCNESECGSAAKVRACLKQSLADTETGCGQYTFEACGADPAFSNARDYCNDEMRIIQSFCSVASK